MQTVPPSDKPFDSARHSSLFRISSRSLFISRIVASSRCYLKYRSVPSSVSNCPITSLRAKGDFRVLLRASHPVLSLALLRLAEVPTRQSAQRTRHHGSEDSFHSAPRHGSAGKWVDRALSNAVRRRPRLTPRGQRIPAAVIRVSLACAASELYRCLVLMRRRLEFALQARILVKTVGKFSKPPLLDLEREFEVERSLKEI